MTRSLDARVATLMGWTDLDDHAYTPCGRLLCGTPPPGEKPMWLSGRSTVPYYSTVLSSAWLVVEHLRQHGWACQINVGSDELIGEVGEYTCRFIGEDHEMGIHSHNARSLPHAIVMAALAAVEDQV